MSHLDSVPATARDMLLAAEAAVHLETISDDLFRVLTRHESHETASDEISRSIDALRNLHREYSYFRRSTNPSVAVFLPINLPLYSLVLFAAIPSIMSSVVTVRTPAATPEWIEEVASLTRLSTFFPRVRLVTQTRASFIEESVATADVVVFTGRWENAQQVREACPRSLFIFEGAGPNPIVVGPNAEFAKNFEQIVTPRLFNSGQDCAGPDMYLIHHSIADAFVSRLENELAGLADGSYADPDVRVGPILNRSPLKELGERLRNFGDAVTFGGRVDPKIGFVEPTVIVREINANRDHYEYFAPVFNLLIYRSSLDLDNFFNSPEYRERAMYASFFGEDPPGGAYETTTVLINQTLLDVERGNDPYGGYGNRANYIARGPNVLAVEPILISRTISLYESGVS